jgi:hypothetical protein
VSKINDKYKAVQTIAPISSAMMATVVSKGVTRKQRLATIDMEYECGLSGNVFLDLSYP